MLNGTWGTTPYRIGKILTHYGVKYKFCKKKEIKKTRKRKTSTYIVSVWQEGGLTDGIHTFAVFAKTTGFMIYNDSDEGKYRTARISKDIFRNRKYIIIYKLK